MDENNKPLKWNEIDEKENELSDRLISSKTKEAHDRSDLIPRSSSSLLLYRFGASFPEHNPPWIYKEKGAWISSGEDSVSRHDREWIYQALEIDVTEYFPVVFVVGNRVACWRQERRFGSPKKLPVGRNVAMLIACHVTERCVEKWRDDAGLINGSR